MLVGCPKCRTKYRVSHEKPGNEQVVLRCIKCHCLFRVAGRPCSLPAATDGDGRSKRRIRVVVANESNVFCQAVAKVLSSEPIDVFTFNDGKSALAAIERMIPDVVLLDVALPLMYGFEVCDAIRKNPAAASVRIILIAAIYDKTRYKREPNSLYGADDYIEKHHIPDFLASKIYQLVSGDRRFDGSDNACLPGEDAPQQFAQQLSAGEMAELESTRMTIRHDEERVTGAKADRGDSEAHVKARRLARLIVSDIALYNQEYVEEGVLNDTFYKLLEEDVRDGRSLYEGRIPVEVRNGTSYLDDAFEELIAQKKRELNILKEPVVGSV